MTSIRNRRGRDGTSESKNNECIEKNLFPCHNIDVRVFREPRSLGSRGVSPRKKINPPLIAENASRKSRRAPTRAPPIILIGGTPVHSRRARYTDTPSRSAAAATPPPPPRKTSFVARPNRIRARSNRDPMTPYPSTAMIILRLLLTPSRSARRGRSGGTRGARRCGSAGAAFVTPSPRSGGCARA